MFQLIDMFIVVQLSDFAAACDPFIRTIQSQCIMHVNGKQLARATHYHRTA